ncbi:DUF6461 domain-containing protein [Streptomyces sp. NPDC059862]|uniref:DUF6461 domain-containing protein n=1 Tax=Streptomyces sp. NPDC059862 TaxID=3346975 RepID=UPI0036690F57
MRQPDPDRDTAAVGGRPRAGLGLGGGWTLALEFGGGVGMTPELLEALSADTRAVTHSFIDGKPVHLFHWFENSELRIAFEWPSHHRTAPPRRPQRRHARRRLPPHGDGPFGFDIKPAVPALAERLTGSGSRRSCSRRKQMSPAAVPCMPRRSASWQNLPSTARPPVMGAGAACRAGGRIR